MVKRPTVLATDPPNMVPRPVVALLIHIVLPLVVELDSVELKKVREKREGLIPAGNEPVVDNEDGREDESGGNNPAKLEVAE